MKSSVFAVMSSILTLMIVMGCGQGKPGRRDLFGKVVPRNVNGTLTSEASEVLNHKFASECEHKNRSRILEITSALDSRAEDLTHLVKHTADNDQIQKIPIGPTHFTRSKKPKDAKQGWQTFAYGWDKIGALYDEIKDSQTDSEWVRLNSAARGILFDDLSRVYGKNYFIDHEAPPKLERLTQTYQKCWKDPKCVSPVLTEEDKAFVRSVPYYQSLSEWLNEATDSNEKRNRIETIVTRRLVPDMDFFGFRVNSGINRNSTSELILPIATTHFLGAESLLTSFIEPVWSSPRQNIKLKWSPQPTPPVLYSILLDPLPGGRAHVSWSEKTMTLFPGTEIEALAHEMGHVIGFPDHYYTLWSPLSCSYRTELNDDDIMSNHSTGKVTDEEWNELLKRYPFSSTTAL